MKKPVLAVLSAVTGAALGAGAVGKASLDKMNIIRSYRDKHLALFLMMNQWVKAKQEGKNLASYFEEKGYKKIAIYGMSYAGETLLNELKGSGISVAYAIDKNVSSAEVRVMSVDDALEEVDAVVVTAITFFDEIEELLSEKMDCPIISLEDILYEV